MRKINKTLRNAIIFIIVFTILFLSDILLKYFLFDKAAENPLIYDAVANQKDYVVIGVRSLAHYSTTFLDFANMEIPNWASILISSIIAAIITVLIAISRTKVAVIGLSIMLAGTLGNTIDNIYHGYVRDVLYTPWLDKGTFNLADVLIIVGLPFALIPTLVRAFKEK